MPVLFEKVVAASDRVSSTRKRSEKVAVLAGLFDNMDESDVPTIVAILSGEPRQGKIGIGYQTIAGLELPPAAQATVTVSDIDRALDQIARTTGEGSQGHRLEILSGILIECTADEQSFIKRLLVGGVRQGALEGIMTEAVAKAAGVPIAAVRRAAMMRPDLGHVAAVALNQGSSGLSEIGLEVLQPIQPMLAKTAASPVDAIEQSGLSSVEWKLDGVRIQVHRSGRTVRIFTRNLNDVTQRLAEVVAMVLEFDTDHLVLDGEVMTLMTDGQPRPFAETMSRFGTEDHSDVGVVPFFFDVLHEAGHDLIDRPLSERQAVVDHVVPERFRVPRLVTDDGDRAVRMLDEARAAGHEGIMVKRIDSLYEAGRRGATWLKVKPAHTLDLVVLAVEWGSGRRAGWLSNVHLGARDPATGQFIMLGKTFKGMTDSMLEWQTKRFLELETHREGHIVHIRPEQVVEIAFDGVQASSRYPGGMTLRFARVKGYRYDKGPEEADTIDAVRAIFE
ncbi:MAG: ATP-dependent DNA ligase [Acidimicrobiia bacterium]|nr:ATP-dependent DNA ligase [Acidimicrobiia bacterium]